MPKYLSPFDPHVHLRGNEYPTQDFIGLAFRDAQAVGLCGMAEMPNPDPQLIDTLPIYQRIQEVDARTECLRPDHFIHVGLTNDTHQVHRALDIVEFHKRVLGDKTFYTHSTGNMGILDKDYQKHLWKLKAERGYKGVSIGHFEDETLYKGVFNPDNPNSHSLVQHEEAELEQVRRQVKNAKDAGFEGTFYIAHVSSPLTVEYVKDSRKWCNFEIILEATFHHTLLCWGAYTDSGNLVKMNPPLRCRNSMAAMMQHVVDGNIDIIGTDHAPHTLSRKNDATSPASGIPALPYWPRFIEILQDKGVSRERIDKMTFYTAARIFGFDAKVSVNDFREVDIEYDPSLWDAYGWNPFEWVDKTYLNRKQKTQVASNALGSTDRGENGLYGTGY